MGEVLAIENPIFKVEDSKFPLEAFPNRIGQLIKELNSTLLFPIEFTSLGVLSAVSTAIGNTSRVTVKNGWNVPSHMYMVIIQNRGFNKTAPMEWALSPLNHINTNSYNKWELEMAEYKALSKEDKETEPKPILETSLVGQITPEALIKTHYDNPKGFLRYSNELKTWFGTFNQFGNNKSEENFWADVWDGHQAKRSTLAHGPQYIQNPCVGVLGSIQPPEIANFIKNNTINGLVDRMLFTYPKHLKDQPLSRKELDLKITEDWFEIYNNIHKVHRVCDLENIQYVKYSKDVLNLFYDWNYSNYEKILDKKDDTYRAIIKKSENNVHRLALTLEVLKNGCKSSKRINSISIESFTNAVKLAEYFNENIFKLREEVDEVAPVIKKEDLWFAQMPLKEFTTAEAYKIADNTVKVGTRTVDKWLAKSENFKRIRNGIYIKNFE